MLFVFIYVTVIPRLTSGITVSTGKGWAYMILLVVLSDASSSLEFNNIKFYNIYLDWMINITSTIPCLIRILRVVNSNYRLTNSAYSYYRIIIYVYSEKVECKLCKYICNQRFQYMYWDTLHYFSTKGTVCLLFVYILYLLRLFSTVCSHIVYAVNNFTVFEYLYTWSHSNDVVRCTIISLVFAIRMVREWYLHKLIRNLD